MSFYMRFIPTAGLWELVSAECLTPIIKLPLAIEASEKVEMETMTRGSDFNVFQLGNILLIAALLQCGMWHTAEKNFGVHVYKFF